MNERITLALDPARCSLCGAPNECNLARGGSGDSDGEGTACWCVDRRFPETLLARARERDGAAACICRRCLEAAAAREG